MFLKEGSFLSCVAFILIYLASYSLSVLLIVL
jgi:hypothetical protein